MKVTTETIKIPGYKHAKLVLVDDYARGFITKREAGKGCKTPWQAYQGTGDQATLKGSF